MRYVAKYYLTYIKNGKKENVALDRLECLSDKDVTDINTIDDFTTFFIDSNEMLTFLKRNNIITDDVIHLFISSDYKCEKDEVKKIANGEEILYKSDRKLLSLGFIKRWISFYRDKDLVVRMCKVLKYKYLSSKEDSYPLEIIDDLEKVIIEVNNRGALPTYLSEDLDKTTTKFVNFEFKKGKNKKWKNIHDMAVLLPKIDENIDKKIVMKEDLINPLIVRDNIKKVFKFQQNSIEEEKNCEEEFLTREDFDRRDEEDILSHYKKDDFEEVRDGQSYIRSKSKDELKRDLRALATEVMEIQRQNRIK